MKRRLNISGKDFANYLICNNLLNDLPEHFTDYSPFVKSWIVDDIISNDEKLNICDLDSILESINFKVFEQEVFSSFKTF